MSSDAASSFLASATSVPAVSVSPYHLSVAIAPLNTFALLWF